ncbi:MAG: hypothetical protein RMJ87_13070 [Cytophagales bacterium]|nr:hypothetical protein [Bernardetiaceae bacterium]MDW8205953.1 hypothetical protein [Cytophagales bacterium]
MFVFARYTAQPWSDTGTFCPEQMQGNEGNLFSVKAKILSVCRYVAGEEMLGKAVAFFPDWASEVLMIENMPTKHSEG